MGHTRAGVRGKAKVTGGVGWGHGQKQKRGLNGGQLSRGAGLGASIADAGSCKSGLRGEYRHHGGGPIVEGGDAYHVELEKGIAEASLPGNAGPKSRDWNFRGLGCSEPALCETGAISPRPWFIPCCCHAWA